MDLDPAAEHEAATSRLLALIAKHGAETEAETWLAAEVLRLREALAASEVKAAFDFEMRQVLWARVNRVLAEGGDKIDVWWLRGLLQHRDQHDDAENTDCSITAP